MANSVPIFQYFAQQNSQPAYTLTTDMAGLTGPAGETFTPVSIEGDILQFMVAPYPINVLKYTPATLEWPVSVSLARRAFRYRMMLVKVSNAS